MQTFVTSTISVPFSETGCFLPALPDSLLKAFEVKDKQASGFGLLRNSTPRQEQVSVNKGSLLPDRSLSGYKFHSFSDSQGIESLYLEELYQSNFTAAKSKIVKCTKCNSELAAGEAFCSECGESL